MPLKAIEKNNTIATLLVGLLPAIGAPCHSTFEIRQIQLGVDCYFSSYGEADECLDSPVLQFVHAVYSNTLYFNFNYTQEEAIKDKCRTEFNEVLKLLTDAKSIKKLPLIKLTGADTDITYAVSGFIMLKNEQSEWAFALYIYDLTNSRELKPMVFPITNI